MDTHDESLNVAITNSERGAFGCQFRWLVSYGLQIVPSVTAHVLRDGDIWHDCMESYWLADGKIQPDAEALQRALDKLEERFQTLFDDMTTGVIINPNPSAFTEPVLREAKGRLASGLVRYDKWNKQIDRQWVVLLNEQHLVTPVYDQHGNQTGHRQAGKIDKIVRLPSGDEWIVEHKTTKMMLDIWLSRHAYSPQAPTYAILSTQELGIKPKGVLFDLMHNKQPTSWRDLPINKDGSLKKYSAKRLPGTTSQHFMKAVEECGITKGWEDEVHRLLQARERKGYWFREEPNIFTDDDINRVLMESHVQMDLIANKERLVAPYRAKVISAAREGKDWRAEAAKAVRAIGHNFTREQSLCFVYMRPCSSLDFCRSRMPEGLSQHRIKDGRHEELGSDQRGEVKDDDMY